MPSNSSDGGVRGIVAFFLAALGAIFVGPLEAVLGFVLYALVTGSRTPGSEGRS